MLGMLGLQICKLSSLPSPTSPTSIDEPCKNSTWMWILQALLYLFDASRVDSPIRWRFRWMVETTRSATKICSWFKQTNSLIKTSSWLLNPSMPHKSCKYLHRKSTFKFWDLCRNLYFVPTHSQSWLKLRDHSLPTTRLLFVNMINLKNLFILKSNSAISSVFWNMFANQPFPILLLHLEPISKDSNDSNQSWPPGLADWWRRRSVKAQQVRCSCRWVTRNCKDPWTTTDEKWWF